MHATIAFSDTSHTEEMESPGANAVPEAAEPAVEAKVVAQHAQEEAGAGSFSEACCGGGSAGKAGSFSWQRRLQCCHNARDDWQGAVDGMRSCARDLAARQRHL